MLRVCDLLSFKRSIPKAQGIPRRLDSAEQQSIRGKRPKRIDLQCVISLTLSGKLTDGKKESCTYLQRPAE